MKFIETLIKNTNNGSLDFIWKYSATNRYSFSWTKHPLNGLNFNRDSKEDQGVIFPNGYEVIFEEKLLETLVDAVDTSQVRTVNALIVAHIAGTDEPEEPTEEGDSETEKKDNE